MRILAFDRNLEQRVGPEVVLGVVYQSRFRESLLVKEEVEASLRSRPDAAVNRIPVRTVAIDLDQKGDLGVRLAHEDVDVVYVAPLRAVDPTTVVTAARAVQAMTVTAVPAFAEESFSVLIEERGSRPSFRLDLYAARQEAVDFDPELYKVASSVKGRGKV